MDFTKFISKRNLLQSAFWGSLAYIGLFKNTSKLIASEKDNMGMVTRNKNRMVTPADVNKEELLNEKLKNKEFISNIPKLEPRLQKQLTKIIPSLYAGIKFYPCKVELQSNRTVENVYIIEASDYKSLHTYWPHENEDADEVNIKEVKNIFLSRNRLPIKLSRKLNGYMETGMGAKIFYFLLRNGERLKAICGTYCDFFEFDMKIGEIKDVMPYKTTHYRTDGIEIYAAKFKWCLYSR